MKNAIVLAGICLALCTLSGCGSNSPDGLMDQQIKSMNAIADAIEAKADEATIKKLHGEMEEIGKKMKELKLSEADQKAIFEKHKDALMKATQRMMAATLKGGIPGLGGPGKSGNPTQPE